MLDKMLLEVLRCPACRADSPLEETNGYLICRACARAYPVVDNIPHMLVEEARPLEEITTRTRTEEKS